MYTNLIMMRMKNLLVAFILLTFGTGYSQGSADTLVIPGYIKFKRIPTCIGENCQSGQCYAPGVSDGPATAYILHPDARIGKIKHCTMLCETPDGICRKMIFTLHDEENVEKAGKQAAKQFGKPVYTKEGNVYVYTWMYATPEKQLYNIRLEVAADQKHGKLFVE